MAAPITFGLYNVDGSPRTTAVPVFVHYVNKAGGVRSQPAINELSGGQYGFIPSDNDEATGTVYLIDAGVGSAPRYVYGEICTVDNPFLTWVTFSATGALTAGAPTVGSYLDINDNVRPSPDVEQAGAIDYLFSLTPTLEDVTIGTSYRVDAAVGTLPANINGLFYNPNAVAIPAIVDGVLGPSNVTLEDALHAWVVAGSDLAASHVIWSHQTGARKLDGPFATIRIGGATPIAAFDEAAEYTDLGRTDEEIEIRVEGIRELPVTVQFFSPDVTGVDTTYELAARTQLALGLPSIRDELATAGLTVFDNGAVQNVPVLIGTAFEGRAVLEVRFYAMRTLSEFVGYIDTVNTRDFMGPPEEGTAELVDIP